MKFKSLFVFLKLTELVVGLGRRFNSDEIDFSFNEVKHKDGTSVI
ncbi:MAG: hypothetical protein ACJATI_000745 [Halioglobus sp.]|jgi:hypothetical protein